MCLKNKIVSGFKTAYRKFINSTPVQRCIMFVLTIAVGVEKIFAQAAGTQGYEAGKNAISQASEQIAQYVPIATKLCYAIAGVVAIVGAISVYVKMNNEEQDVKKSIMMIIGACVFLIAAAQALPLFFGIEDGVLTGF
jgi:formate-dependent nitrite reductase membrane component NrfD